MAVNLSPLAGAGWQFFDNSGVILSGGLLYTYASGTTTPQATYTSSSGSTANSNPIVLDSAGRISSEIWLTQGQSCKFVLKTSTGTTIWTYDNVPGINDQTGLLAFETSLAASSGSSLVGFMPAGTSAVATTTQAKLRQIVSAIDFGAVGNGATDDTAAIQAALNYAASLGGSLYIPTGAYKLTSTLTVSFGVEIYGDSPIIPSTALTAPTKGTWLYFAHNNVGINISVNNGFNIEKIGTYRSTQVLPALGSGTYTPTTQAADIAITTNDYSSFCNITLLNPFIGIQHSGTGGIFVENVLMNPLNIGISIDNCYDTCYLNNIHIWPFWTGVTQYTSWNYTIANLRAILLFHADNPFLSNIFTIFAYTGLEFSSTTYGGASKAHVSNCDFDRGRVGIYVSADNVTAQFENITIQGEFTTPAGANVNGIVIISAGCYLQFGSLDIRNVGEYGIQATAASTSGTIYVDNLTVIGYGAVASAAQAVYASNSAFNFYITGNPNIINGGGASAYAATLKGLGWYYTDVTGSRVIGTTYTNTLNRPMFVTISGTNTSAGNALFYLDGNQIQSTTLSAAGYCSFASYVPPQSTYKVTGFTSILRWTES